MTLGPGQRGRHAPYHRSRSRVSRRGAAVQHVDVGLVKSFILVYQGRRGLKPGRFREVQQGLTLPSGSPPHPQYRVFSRPPSSRSYCYSPRQREPPGPPWNPKLRQLRRVPGTLLPISSWLVAAEAM